MILNEIMEEHYKWVDSMGWHNKTPLESLALIASEVGEAINECRNETPTHLLGSELADIILRVLDLSKCHNIDISVEIYNKMNKNRLRGNLKGRLK